MSLLRGYRVDLLEALKHPKKAAEYINAVLDEEDPKALVLALQDVAEAQAFAVSDTDGDAFSRIHAILARAGLKLTIETT